MTRAQLRLALLLGATAGAGFAFHGALASGPPASKPLVFRGMLTNNGQPVTGAQDVSVRFYATDVSPTVLCVAQPAASTVLTAGRFAVDLPDTCATRVEENPDLFAEVTVGTSPPFPRMRVTAVPYALEAKNALNAPIMTDWAPYTPTISVFGGGAVPNATTTGVWRREGDSVHVHISTSFTGSAPNAALTWDLPNGKVADRSKFLPGGAVCGTGVVGDGGTRSILEVDIGGNFQITASGSGGLFTGLNPLTVGNTTFVNVDCLTPVSGWTTTTGATN